MTDSPVTLGWHWLCELEVPVERATDAARARQVLVELPAAAGLTPVEPPRIQVSPDGSVVGVVLLAESHAAVHATGSRVYLDLFSCRGRLEPEQCLNVARRVYHPVRSSARVERRGS